MKDGFFRVCAATPAIKVCDVNGNVKEIIKLMKEADSKNVGVSVFPETCITGYSCADMFLQEELIEASLKGLIEIKKASAKLKGLYFIGLPLKVDGILINAACAVASGEILGVIPKSYIPDYGEFYEARYFKSGIDLSKEVLIDGEYVTVNREMLFYPECNEDVVIGAEICEDLWVPNPPSIDACLEGANIIVNLSASHEIAGKSAIRRELVGGQSRKLICAYVYASSGEGESSTDICFSGHRLIYEKGEKLAEGDIFTTGLTIADVDVSSINHERSRMTTFVRTDNCYERIEFPYSMKELDLIRKIDASPFVPEDKILRDEKCKEILRIQAEGLKKRIEHTFAKTCVVGISGGLDSTLALIVTAYAFDLIKKDRKDIIAITMPGFGTTDRTYDNACNMVKALGATLKEISIKDAVNQHFKDIEHDPSIHDVTYENSQARERTQILMDVANELGGMVIGTGDLSELCLGWATYNGDHMSMYGVNASIPKTMVRHLVSYYASTCKDKKLSAILFDVLDTPVSPELLPPEEGKISQKTEELVGPYELHDFVMYYILHEGARPRKIYRLAKKAFEGVYDDETIKKWMDTFYRRFFTQQFKRSCIPDGPKVDLISISPRSDFRMPSDAVSYLWREELEKL